ncbi:MAG: RNA 2',3'-cyclic phosphodiesterase [Opitutaceae bacterium]|nr:RNA 2',3'-cyclic phosphodiesterase [Opitutaceae bacterium]
MPSERMFIALMLPLPVRDTVAALAQPLTGLTWTRTEQLHLTLRFLGDVSDEQRPRMRERLSTVHVEPFVLPIEGMGTFPPNRPPRIVFVGVGSGHPRLYQLRQRLDDAVLASGLPLDVRTFHPHITIARAGENLNPAVMRWLHTHREFAAPPFRVEAFDLYASELRPNGAVHTLKQRFPLKVPGE